MATVIFFVRGFFEIKFMNVLNATTAKTPISMLHRVCGGGKQGAVRTVFEHCVQTQCFVYCV